MNHLPEYVLAVMAITGFLVAMWSLFRPSIKVQPPEVHVHVNKMPPREANGLFAKRRAF